MTCSKFSIMWRSKGAFLSLHTEVVFGWLNELNSVTDVNEAILGTNNRPHPQRGISNESVSASSRWQTLRVHVVVLGTVRAFPFFQAFKKSGELKK